MNKLEKIAELRSRAEEALRRSFSGQHSGTELLLAEQEEKLSVSQMETLLENEELRQTKKQLQAELKSYKDLFNYAPLAYFTIDPLGKIVQFNKAAYHFITRQGLQTGKLSIYELIEEQSIQDMKSLVTNVFNTGFDQSGFLQIKNSKLEPNQYRIIMSLVRDQKGAKQLSKMVVFNSLSEENLYKFELRKKEKAYHELMSNISKGIFYTENGILNSVNPSLSHILGYSEKELEGKPLWDLITTCFRKKIRNMFEVEDQTTLNHTYDVKCERKDGTVFWAELKIKHLGEGLKAFGTISDITQRKLTENQLKDSERSLKRSNAAKDKFFSIIAHDLRTPFNTLMGYNYLLMKEYHQYDDQKRESMIRSLYDITKQTFNLLENILVWSRSQTGGIPFAPRSINVNKLIIENIRLYSPTARAKSIQLTTGAGMKDISVFADAEMLQTVIRNLINNAIKFTPDKGKVIISVKDEDQEKVTISVQDNGVGIDPAIKDDLFRIDGNHSTLGTHDEKGTGLGLVICKEFITKNGGEIWIESTPGKGSRFSFTLYKSIQTKK